MNKWIWIISGLAIAGTIGAIIFGKEEKKIEKEPPPAPPPAPAHESPTPGR